MITLENLDRFKNNFCTVVSRKMFYTCMKKCQRHLNIALTLAYLVKMKHHISYFYNALLEHHLLYQAWCETQSSSSTEKTN